LLTVQIMPPACDRNNPCAFEKFPAVSHLPCANVADFVRKSDGRATRINTNGQLTLPPPNSCRGNFETLNSEAGEAVRNRLCVGPRREDNKLQRSARSTPVSHVFESTTQNIRAAKIVAYACAILGLLIMVIMNSHRAGRLIRPGRTDCKFIGNQRHAFDMRESILIKRVQRNSGGTANDKNN